MNIRYLSRSALVISSVLVLSACSSLDFNVSDNIDYKDSRSINSLEVPPDLSAPNYDSTYAAIPGGSVSATALASGKAQGDARAVLPTNAGIQLQRDGNVRWLQVAAPAEVVWPKLQEFWRVMGVSVKRDEPRVGIMETDWAENRAEIPMDGIRKALGKAKMFEKMFDAGSRDRFKLRLERPAAQVTNIFLSHERAEDKATGTGVRWEYAPSRPELEAEMLNRLMIFLQGGDPSQAANTPVPESRLTSVPVAMTQLEGGHPALVVGGGANDVWIRTGIMLQRVGMSIEDQQRAQGIYVATYQGVSDGKEKQGFFSRIFKSDRDMLKIGSRYQIQISDAGNRSIITVGDSDGSPLNPGVAKNLLERLKAEFER